MPVATAVYLVAMSSHVGVVKRVLMKTSHTSQSTQKNITVSPVTTRSISTVTMQEQMYTGMILLW